MTTAPVPSITDDQIAELERFLGFGGKTLKVNTPPLRGLITRLREAERDAARYRWLRDQEALDNAICVLDCGEWVKPAMVIALAYSSAEQCDTAIDTAMQADKCQ